MNIMQAIQIVIIVLGAGTFIEQSRASAEIAKKASDRIERIEVREASKDELIVRLATVVNDLEVRLRKNEQEDASIHSVVQRNTAIIDKYITGVSR